MKNSDDSLINGKSVNELSLLHQLILRTITTGERAAFRCGSGERLKRTRCVEAVGMLSGSLCVIILMA